MCKVAEAGRAEGPAVIASLGSKGFGPAAGPDGHHPLLATAARQAAMTVTAKKEEEAAGQSEPSPYPPFCFVPSVLSHVPSWHDSSFTLFPSSSLFSLQIQSRAHLDHASTPFRPPDPPPSSGGLYHASFLEWPPRRAPTGPRGGRKAEVPAAAAVAAIVSARVASAS